MKKSFWTAVLRYFGVALLVFLAVYVVCLCAIAYEACYRATAEQGQCAFGRLFSAAFLHIVEFIEGHGHSIEAISTVFIAAFTIVLAYVGIEQGLFNEQSLHGKRAFVYADGMPAFWELGPNNLYNWRFRPNWHNAGETRTHSLTEYTDFFLSTTRMQPGFNFRQRRAAPANGFLAPKMSASGPQAPFIGIDPAITPEDIQEVMVGRKFLYLWGWVKYIDVFDKNLMHITRFCWQILPVGDPFAFNPNTPAARLNFVVVLHSEGNTAEEENDYQD